MATGERQARIVWDRPAVRPFQTGHDTPAMRSGIARTRMNRPIPVSRGRRWTLVWRSTFLLQSSTGVDRTSSIKRWVDGYGNMTCLYARDGLPDAIVGHVLAEAGVHRRDLEALSDDGIDDLYRAGTLPISLTFGGFAVLHAAQQVRIADVCGRRSLPMPMRWRSGLSTSCPIALPGKERADGRWNDQGAVCHRGRHRRWPRRSRANVRRSPGCRANGARSDGVRAVTARTPSSCLPSATQPASSRR
jgi:hypothetical protein